MLIAAGVLAGAVRGCQTLLQATIVAERWGMSSPGALQGRFAAPLTAVTALAPAAGPALAAWLGSYTAMAYAMAGAAGLAALIAGALPPPDRQTARHHPGRKVGFRALGRGRIGE